MYPIAIKLEVPCLITDDIPLNMFGDLDTDLVFG